MTTFEVSPVDLAVIPLLGGRIQSSPQPIEWYRDVNGIIADVGNLTRLDGQISITARRNLSRYGMSLLAGAFVRIFLATCVDDIDCTVSVKAPVPSALLRPSPRRLVPLGVA